MYIDFIFSFSKKTTFFKPSSRNPVANSYFFPAACSHRFSRFPHGTYRFPGTQKRPLWLSLLRRHRHPSHNHVVIDLLERSGRLQLFLSKFHTISRSAVKARNVSSVNVHWQDWDCASSDSGKCSMWIFYSCGGGLQCCRFWQNLHGSDLHSYRNLWRQRRLCIVQTHVLFIRLNSIDNFD